MELTTFSPVALLLIGGLPHGAMDAYLAVRIFPKKLSWILSFTAVYLILIGAFLVIWRLAPNLSLTVFLLASMWHFGKLDANTQLKNSSSISWKIFFGLTVPTNLAFFHTNEVRVLLEMLTLENVDLIVDSLAHGWWLWLIMMIVYQAKFFNAPLRLRGEPLGHLLLFAVLPPLWSFCLYFVLIHSLRHTVQVMRQDSQIRKIWWLIAFLSSLLLVGLIATVANHIGGHFLAEFYRVAFVTLAALTIPHMIFIDGFQALSRIRAPVSSSEP